MELEIKKEITKKTKNNTQVEETTYNLYLNNELFKQLVMFEMYSEETMFKKWVWFKTTIKTEPKNEQEILTQFLLIAEEEIKVQIAEQISNLYEE